MCVDQSGGWRGRDSGLAGEAPVRVCVCVCVCVTTKSDLTDWARRNKLCMYDNVIHTYEHHSVHNH